MTRSISVRTAEETLKSLQREQHYFTRQVSLVVQQMVDFEVQSRNFFVLLQKKRENFSSFSHEEINQLQLSVSEFGTFVEKSKKLVSLVEKLNVNLISLHKIENDLESRMKQLKELYNSSRCQHILPQDSNSSTEENNLSEDFVYQNQVILVTELTFMYACKATYERKKFARLKSHFGATQKSAGEPTNFPYQTMFDFYSIQEGPSIKSRWIKFAQNVELYDFLMDSVKILKDMKKSLINHLPDDHPRKKRMEDMFISENRPKLTTTIDSMWIEMSIFTLGIGSLLFIYRECPKVIGLFYVVACDLCDQYLDYRCDLWEQVCVTILDGDLEKWKEVSNNPSEHKRLEVEYRLMSSYIEANKMCKQYLEIYIHKPETIRDPCKLILVPKVISWREIPTSNSNRSSKKKYEFVSISSGSDFRTVEDCANPAYKKEGKDFGSKFVSSLSEIMSRIEKTDKEEIVKLSQSEQTIQCNSKNQAILHKLDPKKERVLPYILRYNQGSIMRYSLTQPEYVMALYIRDNSPKMITHKFRFSSGISSTSSKILNFSKGSVLNQNIELSRIQCGDKSHISSPLTTLPPNCRFTNNLLKLSNTEKDLYIMKNYRQWDLMTFRPWIKELGINLKENKFECSKEFSNNSKISPKDSLSVGSENLGVLYAHLYRRDLPVNPDQLPIAITDFPKLLSEMGPRPCGNKLIIRFYKSKKISVVSPTTTVATTTTPTSPLRLKDVTFLSLNDCEVVENPLTTFSYTQGSKHRQKRERVLESDVSYVRWDHEEACGYLVETFESFFGISEISRNRKTTQFVEPAISDKYVMFDNLVFNCTTNKKLFPNCVKWAIIAKYLVKYQAALSSLNLLWRLSSAKIQEGAIFTSQDKTCPDLPEGWSHESLKSFCLNHCLGEFEEQFDIYQEGLGQCCHSKCRTHKEDFQSDVLRDEILDDSKCRHLGSIHRILERLVGTKNALLAFLTSKMGSSLFKSCCYVVCWDLELKENRNVLSYNSKPLSEPVFKPETSVFTIPIIKPPTESPKTENSFKKASINIDSSSTTTSSSPSPSPSLSFSSVTAINTSPVVKNTQVFVQVPTSASVKKTILSQNEINKRLKAKKTEEKAKRGNFDWKLPQQKASNVKKLTKDIQIEGKVEGNANK